MHSHRQPNPLPALLVAVALLVCQGCSLLPGHPAPAAPAPAAPEGGVTFTLGGPVELLMSSVPADGGTLTVARPGDPLDGLSIQVPEGAYPEAVEFRVSYRPIEDCTSATDFAPITPLLKVDNGGRVADEIVTVRLPADIPAGRFPMAFFYDEETGGLEGLPTLLVDDSSLTVMTQHFSTIVVTAADYSALEHFQMDTGFAPGKDTWQIENRGSYLSPQGICWGMSVSSLWYYLEEPWRISGERLWGQYDSDLGAELKTPGLWQDDTFAVMVATAAQESWARAAHNREFNVVRRLEQEAIATGNRINVKLTADEIAFYSLVTAMGLTGQPQLMTVWTADGRDGHAVVCYKVENGTLYVADPNDNGAQPPERTIVFKDGKFAPYTSAANLDDVLAGRFFDFPSIRYWGQSALGYWQDVGRLWDLGTWQEGYPGYRLLVVERDDGGNVSQEYDLDLHNPLYTTQDALELKLIPEEGLEARLQMTRVVEEQSSAAKLAGLQAGPLSLAPGENLVGVYVEGKASWVDSHGQQKSHWRWLGFHWTRVVREESGEAPTATEEAAEKPTATRPPAESAGFTAEDCACEGIVPAGYTPMDASSFIPKQGEYTIKNRSQGPLLDCDVQWRGESLVSLKTYAARQPGEQATAEAVKVFASRREALLAPHEDDRLMGAEITVVEDVADSRLTLSKFVGNKNHVFYGTWYGDRLLVYKGSYVALSLAGLEGEQEEVLRLLDAAETCATAAIDRLDSQ